MTGFLKVYVKDWPVECWTLKSVMLTLWSRGHKNGGQHVHTVFQGSRWKHFDRINDITCFSNQHGGDLKEILEEVSTLITKMLKR